ncbi:hypothetical protein LBMAG09_06500 [Actinomycetes bacterium]|nr:hypothetical protein LBMAG09_06500 [Actinomycetes bacterium]
MAATSWVAVAVAVVAGATSTGGVTLATAGATLVADFGSGGTPLFGAGGIDSEVETWVLPGSGAPGL